MGDTAKRDPNYVPSLTAVSNVDGLTPVTLYADPVTHRLLTSSSSSIGYDATAGSVGADYSTLKAAIDAGATKILVIANTTETANITVPDSVFLIHIVSGVTVAMGAYRFTGTGTGATRTVRIRGEGTISYAHTNANEELFDLDNNNVVDLDGPSITNSSTASGCKFAYFGVNQRVRNCSYALPNQAAGGLEINRDGSIDAIEFTGGGTSCTLALDLRSGANPINVVDVSLFGTFKASSSTSADSVLRFHGGNVANIRYWVFGSAIRIEVDSYAQLTNVQADFGNADINLYIGSNCRVSNIFVDDGSIVVTGTDSLVDNFWVWTIDVSAAGASECSFSNFSVGSSTSTPNLGGDRNKFTNGKFVGGMTVVSGADNNGFMNCQFGGSGGGTKTLTVNAGSNNTRIIGCITDAAISDAG